jgi:hypothetical protein
VDKKTIDRESGDKSKGSRLQRLRAIRFLLDKLNDLDNVAVYVATEFLDDVYQQIVKVDGTVEIISEGDKNYKSGTTFTFHSDEVKNTLVGFIDCLMEHYSSASLFFCFYTNAKFSSENNIKEITEVRPNESILQQLMNKDFSDPLLLPYVKTVIINDYKKQYKSKKHKNKGYLSILEKWDDTQWIDFLNNISWLFEKEDDKELEISLLELIKRSNPYSFNIEGKEKQVLISLEHEFERKQERKDYFTRIMTASEVKTCYLEVAKDVYKNCDPVHELWDEIPKPTDNRNLSLKIRAVCNTYSEKELGLLARRVCEAKLELKRVDYKDRCAYQYRVFTAAERKIGDLLKNHTSKTHEKVDIDNWIDELVNYSNAQLEERSKDYTYAFTNKETLKNTILELFDSCYLAFDEGDINGE